MAGPAQAWRDEIALALAINPGVVLTGNIRDRQLMPGTSGHQSTLSAIREVLESNEFEVILLYSLVDGLQLVYENEASEGAAARAVGRPMPAEPIPMSPHELADLITRIVPTAQTPDAERAEIPRTALIIAQASRLRDPEYPHADQVHDLLTCAAQLAHDADQVFRPGAATPTLYNPVIWMVDRQQDLPHWLGAIAPMRVVSIPFPTLSFRTEAAERFAPQLPGWDDLDEAARARVIDEYATGADGMGLREMLDIRALARFSGIRAEAISSAVLLYRVGLQVSPWRDRGLRDKIRTSAETLSLSVKGQERAIEKVHRVLTKAFLGISGAHHGKSHPHKPQGVLFFAGPTGVGKTELAKALAWLIFGSSDSLIRMDMSEYSTEHSEARLIGAPPGYTGHNAGGELTNAVRERPFSILLFDEFEKAHPSIFDKFLQIIDEGRLTDGSGSTVHFSETLIVFTTNLGIYQLGQDGQRRPVVTPSTSPEEVQRSVRAAIEDHFTRRLGKPELFGRFGENIVVFDFIRPAVVPAIVDKFLGNVRNAIRDRIGVDLVIADPARDALIEGATAKLDFGGRGVGSLVEERLIEPLGTRLFDLDPDPGTRVTVRAVTRDGESWDLELA